MWLVPAAILEYARVRLPPASWTLVAIPGYLWRCSHSRLMEMDTADPPNADTVTL